MYGAQDNIHHQHHQHHQHQQQHNPHHHKHMTARSQGVPFHVNPGSPRGLHPSRMPSPDAIYPTHHDLFPYRPGGDPAAFPPWQQQQQQLLPPQPGHKFNGSPAAHSRNPPFPPFAGVQPYHTAGGAGPYPRKQGSPMSVGQCALLGTPMNSRPVGSPSSYQSWNFARNQQMPGGAMPRFRDTTRLPAHRGVHAFADPFEASAYPEAYAAMHQVEPRPPNVLDSATTEKLLSSVHTATNPLVDVVHSPDRWGITVTDPLAKRKVACPLFKIETTNGLIDSSSKSHTHSICILYQNNKCKVDRNCNQIHVDRQYYECQRQGVPCCYSHHDHFTHALISSGVVVLPAVALVVSQNGNRVAYSWPIDRCSLSLGLSHCPVRILDGEEVLVVDDSRVCQVWQGSRCTYGKECNYVHLCRASYKQIPKDAPNRSTAGSARPRQQQAQQQSQNQPSTVGTPNSVLLSTPDQRYSVSPQHSLDLPGGSGLHEAAGVPSFSSRAGHHLSSPSGGMPGLRPRPVAAAGDSPLSLINDPVLYDVDLYASDQVIGTAVPPARSLQQDRFRPSDEADRRNGPPARGTARWVDDSSRAVGSVGRGRILQFETDDWGGAGGIDACDSAERALQADDDDDDEEGYGGVRGGGFDGVGSMLAQLADQAEGGDPTSADEDDERATRYQPTGPCTRPFNVLSTSPGGLTDSFSLAHQSSSHKAQHPGSAAAEWPAPPRRLQAGSASSSTGSIGGCVSPPIAIPAHAGLPLGGSGCLQLTPRTSSTRASVAHDSATPPEKVMLRMHSAAKSTASPAGTPDTTPSTTARPDPPLPPQAAVKSPPGAFSCEPASPLQPGAALPQDAAEVAAAALVAAVGFLAAARALAARDRADPDA
ncbi:hypothetical protein DIPPA_22073, partial [Diplonema papillatum]